MRKRFLIPIASVLVALPALGQDPAEAFMTQFEEAVKADNYAQMKSIVIKNQAHLIPGYFIYEAQLCSAISNKNEEDRTARLNVLEKLVNFANQELKDRFPADRLAWAKTLTPEQAIKRLEAAGFAYEGGTAWAQADKSGDKAAWAAAREKYLKGYPVAKEIGDVYWTIEFDALLAGVAERLEEGFEASYHYKRAFETARETKSLTYSYLGKYNLAGKLKQVAKDLRDDLIDIAVPLEESKKKYAETIEKLAAEAAKPGGEAGKEGEAGAAATGELPGVLPPMANKHTARIEWVDAPKAKVKEAVGRPFLTSNVQANGPWFMWRMSAVTPGSPARAAEIPGENVLKNDNGKLLFDPDGAGKAAEERLKVQEGKPNVVAFKNRPYQDSGAAKVNLSYRIMEEPRSFSFNGLSLSLNSGKPSESPIRLRWQGATTVSTKVEGYDLTIFDDNANGEFANWGDDSIAISKGASVRVGPLSRYVYLGDLLYELKLDPNGENLRVKPYDGPIALLEFKYVAATMPAFMILEGLNEQAQAFFNLMDCRDKPMWVPPGEYKFKNGYFVFGEGEKRETIAVANTRCTQFAVREGRLNKYEMGGAKAPGFTYAWKAEIEKDKGKTIVRIPGKSVQVFGCAGEEYGLFLTGVVRPHVKMRSGSADGAVFYNKQMRAPATEDLDDGGYWGDVALFPKTVEAEKTASGDVFVQLEGDYPKLGKITSTPQQVQ